ncbi:MAG: prolyl oligopeptidase family serine peptidase [Trueperella sp.]|nr:prolyl oligopeptidase family serine peptidase [Trueperella sp.]
MVSEKSLLRRLLRKTYVLWILAVLLLGAWGAWAGPGYNPKPMPNAVIPQTADTAIKSLVETPRIGQYSIRVSIHEVEMPDGKNIKVTLREPIGVDGQRPGVVFLHGTGTYKHTAFSPHAQWLASAGVVTAVPDKPLVTYSVTERDYTRLGQHYLAVANWLRNQESVYRAQVGYYGESEGALIAPISVANDPQAAFTVLVSDPVIPIKNQGALAAVTYLRDIGGPAQLYAAAIRAISGALAEEQMFNYARFNPAPYHQQMKIPVLMIYGTEDSSTPQIQGPLQLKSDLDKAENSQLLVRYYAQSDHGLRINGFISPLPYQDTADFINGLPSAVTESSQIAGAQPRQDFTAPTFQTPRWFGSMPAMLVILALGVIFTAVGAVMATGGYIYWRRNQDQPTRKVGAQLVRRIWRCGFLVLALWLLFIGYLFAIVQIALNYEQNRLLVQGGWLILQAVALLAVLAVVRLGQKWVELAPKNRYVTATLAVAALGYTLLLFSIAYWGIFPSIVSA